MVYRNKFWYNLSYSKIYCDRSNRKDSLWLNNYWLIYPKCCERAFHCNLILSLLDTSRCSHRTMVTLPKMTPWNLFVFILNLEFLVVRLSIYYVSN